jgi:hypothetical protein
MMKKGLVTLAEAGGHRAAIFLSTGVLAAGVLAAGLLGGEEEVRVVVHAQGAFGVPTPAGLALRWTLWVEHWEPSRPGVSELLNAQPLKEEGVGFEREYEYRLVVRPSPGGHRKVVRFISRRHLGSRPD